MNGSRVFLERRKDITPFSTLGEIGNLIDCSEVLPLLVSVEKLSCFLPSYLQKRKKCWQRDLVCHWFLLYFAPATLLTIFAMHELIWETDSFVTDSAASPS